MTRGRFGCAVRQSANDEVGVGGPDLVTTLSSRTLFKENGFYSIIGFTMRGRRPFHRMLATRARSPHWQADLQGLFIYFRHCRITLSRSSLMRLRYSGDIGRLRPAPNANAPWPHLCWAHYPGKNPAQYI